MCAYFLHIMMIACIIALQESVSPLTSPQGLTRSLSLKILPISLAQAGENLVTHTGNV